MQYTVLDYGFGPSKDKTPQTGPQRWLKVRNPWGHTNAKIRPVAQAVETERGGSVFWLELSDVTKRFKSVASIDRYAPANSARLEYPALG